MNEISPVLAVLTADDFLRWNEGREGRREFVDGRVTEMMTGVSKNHNRVATNLVIAFGRHLDRSDHDFGTADFGVRTHAGIRYPDLYVEARTQGGHHLAASEPLLLAEILSPSSLATDFGPKALEYTAIPSLRHYLVLSQDEPRVWLWSRGEAGFGEPEMIAGIDQSVTLGAFGLTLALADLYRGIG